MKQLKQDFHNGLFKHMVYQTSFLKKIYAKLPVLCFDILACPLSWFLAYWLQYNMRPLSLPFFKINSLWPLFLLMTLQVISFYHFKVYRGLWRFSSLNDVTRIIFAISATIILIIPILYMLGMLREIPRSILPIYGMLMLLFLCGGRLITRMASERKQTISYPIEAKRVVIIGAGQAGEGLIRDLKRTHSYFPIGVIDDDKNKKGLEVHGVRVLGTIADLTWIVKEEQVDLIFIAIPSARSATMRHIVKACEGCNIPFRTLPSIHEIAAGKVEVNALRALDIHDLLGRDQVDLQWDKISTHIRDKKILVTGGGGSIGSELCLQILKQKPSKLLILDNNEFNLYKIEMEMKRQFPDARIEVTLVSIIDKIAIDHLFHQFRPDMVFHAAAYKHVPLLEDQVRVAVQNNVMGTQL